MPTKINNASKPVASKAGANAATTSKNLVNVEFDKATQDFLNASYGTEAAWYNDPQIGPVLRSALTAGPKGTALQGQQYQDYIRSHAVDASGKVVSVAPDQSWYGTHGAAVRQAFGQKLSDPGTYNQNVKNNLDALVIPTAQQLGLNLDNATLQKVAEDSYTNGWLNTDQIKKALLAQNAYDPTKALSMGGAVGKAATDFAAIAKNYGVPLPKDPTSLKSFIDQAVGPNGTEDSFTNYAKEQAKLQFPWMSGAIDAGVTPKAWLTPIATQIGNTLDIAPDQIDWTDPKWNSILTTPVAGDPTKAVPNTINSILTKVKTDPVFGYDHTQNAINDAYALGSQIRSMMGFGA